MRRRAYQQAPVSASITASITPGGRKQMAQPRIVVIGGGFGGLFTALDLTGAGEVTLISREDHFLFTPLLYEYLSGEVEAWHIAPNYKELLDERIRFIRGDVTEIDL